MGIHAHIGSQIFEIKPFLDEVEIMLKLVKEVNENNIDINLTEVDLGGGIGVYYTTDDKPTTCLLYPSGASLVYGDDGKSYWYTGITSSGGDESTVGFMLVDSRTKEAKLYMQTGATETAAMTSAEGKVQEKNYDATFPVMYNIYGTPNTL